MKSRKSPNFDDPVGCTSTAFVCEFVGVADYTDIRFNIICIIFIQKNGKWCNVDLTGYLLRIDVTDDGMTEKKQDFLMDPAGRCHVVNLSVNQLGSASFRKIVDIIDCIDMLLG